MTQILNTLVSNTFTTVSTCVDILTPPRSLSFTTSNPNDKDGNSIGSPNSALIDYDTAELLSDLTPKNEDKIEHKINPALELLDICTSTKGSITLFNCNGVEVQTLRNGENSISKIPVGLYYIAIVDNCRTKALKPVYCLR